MWKIVKHGERGCGTVSAEGPERFIRFAFDAFKPNHKAHYAELFDPDGNQVARNPPSD